VPLVQVTTIIRAPAQTVIDNVALPIELQVNGVEGNSQAVDQHDAAPTR
jgi:hypothetical protein